MARFYYKGAYVTVGTSFDHTAPLFRGQIIGGPTRIKAWPHSTSMAGVKIDLWTVRVMEEVTDEGWVERAPKTVVATQLQLRPWDYTPPGPPTIHCPECGEEDYMLEGDYLCAPCRFLQWDGPLT